MLILPVLSELVTETKLLRVVWVSITAWAFLTTTAVEILVDHNVKLVGTDANTIGSDFDNNKTHKLLLENGIPILECLNLSKIEDGDYEICAFPLKIEAVEASPCRAVLLEQEKGI